MAEEWKRTEILLEAIRGDVKAVLEGHSVLDKKIETVKDLITEVDQKVGDTQKAVKEIGSELKEHLRQPHMV